MLRRFIFVKFVKVVWFSEPVAEGDLDLVYCRAFFLKHLFLLWLLAMCYIGQILFSGKSMNYINIFIFNVTIIKMKSDKSFVYIVRSADHGMRHWSLHNRSRFYLFHEILVLDVPQMINELSSIILKCFCGVA